MRLELRGQPCERLLIFGDHQQPCGALVQAMHNAWPDDRLPSPAGAAVLAGQPSRLLIHVLINICTIRDVLTESTTIQGMSCSWLGFLL